MDAPTTDTDFLTHEDGRLQFDLHPGQGRAWKSDKRFVAVLAGKQSGKTVLGPLWMWREIQRNGPGAYLVVTPTYPLLQKKLLPEFKRLFERYLGLGTYKASDKQFEVSRAGEVSLFGETQDEKTAIHFGYATKPESLASTTAKAAWLDEAGQDQFKAGAWEEIQDRLSIHSGRVLFTTTLYNLGWLIERIWRPWQERDGNHPEIDVVRFESIENPAFQREEWERLKDTRPRWKFNLHYRAIPTRPAGLIYDAFDRDRHTVEPFDVPDDWPRFVGLDFGGVNTAATFYARDPDSGTLYLIDTYHQGGKTAEEHAEDILEGHQYPKRAVGGSSSEGQFRREFRAGGLPVREPKLSGPDSVEVGIDRVYGFHKRNELQVFADCTEYLEEKQSYSRVLDDDGQPTEKIQDKSEFHLMDAERYILGELAPSGQTGMTAKEMVSKW